jgi:hypothetical protein
MNQYRNRRTWAERLFMGACAILALASAAFASAQQQDFPTPDAGVAALVDAIRSDDLHKLRAILGPQGAQLVSSGDPVDDAASRAAFAVTYDQANRIALGADGRAELLIGKDEWPMPIPLVRSADGHWRFDTRSGAREILARRIGRNELAAIQTTLAIVDAEREYASRDIDRDGLGEYAARITSRPGKRDGLYWPTRPFEPQSPLGPLLAAAAHEGYPRPSGAAAQPYHGYLFRILGRQGPNAPGGAYSYFVHGRMIAGFALIAYPARHGSSGVMSFMVNQDGVVRQRNLGADTTSIAASLSTYNPDASWEPVPDPVRITAGR